MVELFTNDYCSENNVNPRSFSSDALGLLKSHSWPGNIRELKNIVYRILILSDSTKIGIDSIPKNIILPVYKNTNTTSTSNEHSGIDLQSNEKNLIKTALENNKFNISKTSKELNIGRTTLYRKMKKYGLD